MNKNKSTGKGTSKVVSKGKQSTEQVVATPVTGQLAEPMDPSQTRNNTLTYRKNHPGNRCSFGVAGAPGIVVFDVRLFADGKPPASIVLDCNLALPKAGKDGPERG